MMCKRLLFELLDQVKYCWRNWRSGDALLIFNDVTDYDAIEPYLPPLTEARFKVLLTTRLRLGKSVNQLELNVLDEAAALALLQSLVGGERIQAELDEAKLLCGTLGYLPLGLELVGRYVAAIRNGEAVSDLLVALERTLRHELGGSNLQVTESNICKAFNLQVGSWFYDMDHDGFSLDDKR